LGKSECGVGASLQEALANFGTPEIFNTDQGSQFTSSDFTDVLKAKDIKISMDGKGRWCDNVFIERVWPSLKHEDIYLKHYATLPEAKIGIQKYFHFYNEKRRHQGLGNDTPNATYTRISKTTETSALAA
jgi:putative transposase